MRHFRYSIILILIATALALIALLTMPLRADACGPEPVTPNTPTGIAGCERWGGGIASMYGPGGGVAMNFCTWEVRHADGCGVVAIRAHDTGLVVTVPVVDFCDCYTGTPTERIVDLQYDVVAALGLDPAAGLWPVTVTPANGSVLPPRAPGRLLPDTSMDQ